MILVRLVKGRLVNGRLIKDGCIVLYLSISIALLTAWAFQKRSRTQRLTLCRSLHAEALQATVNEGFFQSPRVTAREGFEPTTSRSKGIDSTNAPPRPTWFANGRLIKRTVRQRRNKCETLCNIIHCPLAKYLGIHQMFFFINRRCYLMFMR